MTDLSRPMLNRHGAGMAEPVLHFPLDQWQRLRLFIRRCPIEISGFGLVRQSPDDPMLFLVERIMILDQRADTHSTTTDERSLHQLLYELTLTDEADKLRLQWHSHVDMPAYFSAIDLSTIDRYPGDWMISLVGNHRNELDAQLDVLRPFRVCLPMRVTVAALPDQQLVDEVDQQIRQHVRRAGTLFRGVRPSGVIDLATAASEMEAEEYGL